MVMWLHLCQKCSRRHLLTPSGKEFASFSGRNFHECYCLKFITSVAIPLWLLVWSGILHGRSQPSGVFRDLCQAMVSLQCTLPQELQFYNQCISLNLHLLQLHFAVIQIEIFGFQPIVNIILAALFPSVFPTWLGYMNICHLSFQFFF